MCFLNSKKGIYAARRSELNEKCSKQANVLMIVAGENRHYTAIKPRLPKGTLSDLRQFLTTEIPLKIMKNNVFYFTLVM